MALESTRATRRRREREKEANAPGERQCESSRGKEKKQAGQTRRIPRWHLCDGFGCFFFFFPVLLALHVYMLVTASVFSTTGCTPRPSSVPCLFLLWEKRRRRGVRKSVPVTRCWITNERRGGANPPPIHPSTRIMCESRPAIQDCPQSSNLPRDRAGTPSPPAHAVTPQSTLLPLPVPPPPPLLQLLGPASPAAAPPKAPACARAEVRSVQWCVAHISRTSNGSVIPLND